MWRDASLAATAMGCASSQPVAPEPKTRARRGVHAGVRLSWLKHDFLVLRQLEGQ